MKIGDNVLIKGTVDEIRKDTVIIKNEGGYFGTVPSEIITMVQIGSIEDKEGGMVFCNAKECKWHDGGQCQKTEKNGWIYLSRTHDAKFPAVCDDFERKEPGE